MNILEILLKVILCISVISINGYSLYSFKDMWFSEIKIGIFVIVMTIIGIIGLIFICMFMNNMIALSLITLGCVIYAIYFYINIKKYNSLKKKLI